MPDGMYLRITGDAEVNARLARLGVRVRDLDFTQIANEGMRLAARFAPRRSGRLKASIKANKAKSRAVIRAGNARVKYAGAINYGWRARNIRAANFMERADARLRVTVPRTLDRQIKRIIRRQGLS